ncbi:MAG: aldo/keto reductase [Bacteroidales bacterium]|jgi:aryl-alcohol dehydrogenase-like predicted oxidoreductase|nr:aldo/keto reductase [Bacteroidales bacterium]
MKYIKLGKRGPLVSTVGFGSWGISGRDWGKTDDDISRLAIHKAIDEGVNFIDTADVYGFGHSEELISKVLAERSDRKNIIIATKAGNNFYPYLKKDMKLSPLNHDYSVQHLVYAAEQSLKRLNVDALDILQLHSPDTDILEKDEPWLALEKLKKDGKIIQAGWSVQSFRESEQSYILERHHELLDVIQVRFNLLEREAEEILLPLAEKHGTGVIVRIPLLFGLLTGKFNSDSTFSENDHRRMNLSPEKLKSYLDAYEKFKEVYEQYGDYSDAQLSLRFCISHPACHVVIPSGKTPDQVRENVVASDIDFISRDVFDI